MDFHIYSSNAKRWLQNPAQTRNESLAQIHDAQGLDAATKVTVGKRNAVGTAARQLNASHQCWQHTAVSKPTCLRWASFSNWNYTSLTLHCGVSSQVYSNIRCLFCLYWIEDNMQNTFSLPHQTDLKVSVQKFSSEINLLPNTKFRIILPLNIYFHPWMGMKSLHNGLKINILHKELGSSILVLRYTPENSFLRKATPANRRSDLIWCHLQGASQMVKKSAWLGNNS